ncbi:uncharacterized protein LOC111659709 [Seriola lalandi dorsalis]|uniref:uncharacterized protein LOC111659709 n=1 Tax=Seriola lalandi dorsalis TaxID=1841481 RepID=UPI000C6F66C0|nr:uncharacterized protein LOC111659709 [Seriola lalandi dorsalis]
MSDSKKFLCGLERYGPDSFIEVDLKVKHGPEKTAKTVTVGSTVSFDAMSSSITSFSSSDVITNMSPSYTTLHITIPTASITPGAGSVPYLVISSIVIITIMLVLLTLMRKMMKKQQMSSANSPQEDTQEAVEYDEIRTEDHQAERPPVAVSAIHSSTDADTETLYVNYFYHQGTELAAACGKYSSSRSRVSPRGARAESRVTGPQNDLVYSAAQLSKQQIGLTGKSEPNQSESNEDSFYSLAQPQVT